MDLPLAIVRSEKRQEASAGLAQQQQSAECALCPWCDTNRFWPRAEPRLQTRRSPRPLVITSPPLHLDWARGLIGFTSIPIERVNIN